MRTSRRGIARVLAWLAMVAGGLAVYVPAYAQSKGGGKTPPPNIARPICFEVGQKNQSVLQRADVNGTSIITVNTGVRSQTQWPRWSPDGLLIGGYYKTVNKDAALMVMSPSGANEHVVMTATQFNAWNLSRPGVLDSRYPSNRQRDFPCWLGNDAFIFAGDTTYDATLFGGTPGETITATRLFIVDATGTIAPLTEIAALGGTDSDYNAHWSPALNKIVFNGSGQLYAINPDGTDLVPIIRSSNVGNWQYAVWSPAGDRLVVGEGLSRSLWILDVDLSQPNPGMGEGGRVTAMLPFKAPTDGQIRTPAWSPDGRFLVYSRSRYTVGDYILVADVVTGDEHVVCGPVPNTWGADWDPLDFGL